MKKIIRLTEGELHNIIASSVKKYIKEGFEDDYNSVMNNRLDKGLMNGFEYKNTEGDWEYGDVTFDPNTMTMSCNGHTIEVDSSLSVNANLEALYEKMMEDMGYPSQE